MKKRKPDRADILFLGIITIALAMGLADVFSSWSPVVIAGLCTMFGFLAGVAVVR